MYIVKQTGSTMAVSDQFCLRWNDHQNTLLTTFDTLLDSQKLTDVTLWAGGKYLKAHKVVLSACSPYFDKMLEVHDEKNPIIIFNELSYEQLRAMLEYMYRGEVNVSQEQLDSFLKVAESLKIKGLTDQGGGGDIKGGGSKKKPLSLPPSTSSSSSLSKGRESPMRKRKRPSRRGSESGTESIEEETKSESSTGGLLQPKVELTEDNGGAGVEDLTMMEEEEDEEYYHHQSAAGSSSRLAVADGSVQPHPPPDIKDFGNWDMTNDGFMGSQEISGNSALNSSQVLIKTEPQESGEPVPDIIYRTSITEGPFICDFCQKKYKHKRTLMTHKKYECENSQTTSGPHTCDSCGKVYKHRRNLCAHKKYDCGMEPQFACTICERKFKFKSNLKAHFNACHKKHIVLMLPNASLESSGSLSITSYQNIGTSSKEAFQ